jgi:hypothetical protein
MKRACLAAFLAGCLGAQDTTRGIVPEAVLQARPHPKAATPAPAPKYVPQGTPGGSARAGAKQLGVTIWRLRAATGDDRGARILVQEQSVQEQSGTTSWIPERVSSTTSLSAGDRLRLTFESPEPGYLYVIDRERYSTGERGVPYLIFPTTRTRGGDNRVAAGKLIDIPGQDDRPNFFTMHKSRADQAEEEITVLLMPQPLEGVEIGAAALALSAERVVGWEKKWKGKVETFELAGGAGKAWTAAEQRAAADASRLLTQEDPAPQTVYRVETGPGDPTLITVRLRYR